MHNQIFLASLFAAYTLFFIFGYSKFFRSRPPAFSVLRLLTMLAIFLVGWVVSAVIASTLFFGLASIAGPPLQSNSWAGYEKYGLLLAVYLECCAVGYSTGKMSTETVSRLSE